MTATNSPPPRSRSGCLWAFTVLVLIIVGGGAVIAGGMAWLFNSLTKSEAALQALKRANDTPAVSAKLGTPIVRGTFATGSYAINSNGSGEADLDVPVSGPKGSGRLLIVGKRTDHRWSYSRIALVPADGTPEIPVP